MIFATTLLLDPRSVRGEGEWETSSESEAALERGLRWLARNQGAEGNWSSNDLGLVSMGALAFLAAGHAPGRGRYGEVVERAIDHVVRHAKPSGLLNISHSQRDMYNHGLAAFVLGQAYGRTADHRVGPVLDRALRLIVSTQCDDGGWDYEARRQRRGHDLSLAVMQAKALRGAVDSGLEVPPETIRLAIESVHGYYRSRSGIQGRSATEADLPTLRAEPGQFTYDGNRATLAMAAAGVVCLQEFGRYDDWRIRKNLDVIREAVLGAQPPREGFGALPCEDAYTLYYVAQALYQVGGADWKACYPVLRDSLVRSQISAPTDASRDGAWADNRRVHGLPGQLYGTAVACFVLAIPNRYLPILQEGEIDSVANRFGGR